MLKAKSKQPVCQYPKEAQDHSERVSVMHVFFPPAFINRNDQMTERGK